jgi:ribosomal protein S18 acetylase RimI-like enzyme
VEKSGEGAARFVGLSAFEASATAEHGWSGRLACLYVAPEARRRGIGKWLLAESLEFARYYGLNHVVCDTRADDTALAALLAGAGLRAQPVNRYRIDLPPLYDEG